MVGSKYAQYNYYVMPYVQEQEATRYKTHNKRELRNIYQEMVSKNKSQPLYKFALRENSQTYAIAVKESASQLKSISSQLGPEQFKALFNKQTAESDDATKVSAVLEDDSTHPHSQFTVSVEQIAAEQVNRGKLLKDKSKVLNEGIHKFVLETSGKRYSVHMTIGPEDKNLSSQEKTASMINRLDAGVHASLYTDGKGSSMIELLSSNELDPVTGVSFSMFDEFDEYTAADFGIVHQMGLNNVHATSRDAKFSLNGEAYTAKSNQLLLDNGVEITLKGPTDSDLNVYITTDTSDAKSKISEFVESYNHMIQLSLDHADEQQSASKLSKDIRTATKVFSNQLESIGINIEDNGKLSIDESLLDDSLNNDNHDKVLSGIKGFTASMARKSSDIMINPMEYVDKKLITYSKPEPNVVNVYHPSIYTGMLFNYYL